MMKQVIHIYTDGSCNPDFAIGGWASLILIGNEKITLSGYAKATTHQRMELTAVISALEYVIEKKYSPGILQVYTDSQYVAGLARRKEKLVANDFTTRRQAVLRNADLLKKLFTFNDALTMEYIKVKAHQKQEDRENECNAQVDQLSRKVVRDAVALLRKESDNNSNS